MGIRFKVDGVEQKSGESGHTNEFSDDTPIHVVMPANKYNEMYEAGTLEMSKDMTEHLWSVINENTGLQQQVTLLKYKLESIKRILAE
tara:strand:- start:1115 stop:1378 length:264 start_codon:yes stop_codon:yes gene_type:complete